MSLKANIVQILPSEHNYWPLLYMKGWLFCGKKVNRKNLDEMNCLDLISIHSTHEWNHIEFTSNAVRIHTWHASQDDHMLPFKFTAHFIELDICCTMKSYLCHLHPTVQLRGPNSWLKWLLERLQIRMFAISHSVVSYLLFPLYFKEFKGCEYSKFILVNIENKRKSPTSLKEWFWRQK